MCEYCEKGKRLEERENDNMFFEIYGKHLRGIGNFYNTFRFGRDVLINYCPICGRELKEDKRRMLEDVFFKESR